MKPELVKMGYAVELFMDDEQAVRIIQAFEITDSILLKIGASPHIALALFDEVDITLLCDIVSAFVQGVKPIKLRFGSIGIFPGNENTLFLAPVVTRELLALHHTLHKRLGENNLQGSPLYHPGSWVPHLTITMEEPWDECIKNLELIRSLELFDDYLFNRMDIVEFRPVKKIAEFKLGQGCT
ncbi:MAG: 2'-5' RNA ligase family protein [Thermodesulfobacteriota bacterium]